MGFLNYSVNYYYINTLKQVKKQNLQYNGYIKPTLPIAFPENLGPWSYLVSAQGLSALPSARGLSALPSARG